MRTFDIHENDSRYIILDQETGKTIECDVFLSTRSRLEWERVCTDVLAAFIECGGHSSTEIISYIIRNRCADNRLVDTYDSISENTKTSKSSVKRVMGRMMAKGLLKKIRNGVYMVDGSVIRYGSKSAGAAIAAIWEGESGKHR